MSSVRSRGAAANRSPIALTLQCGAEEHAAPQPFLSLRLREIIPAHQRAVDIEGEALLRCVI
jgi:hypothetical protein